MAKARITVKANMSTRQAQNAMKKIEKEKERRQAVSKAQKAKDSLDKLK